jgi:uncharacterized protein YfbU (UPF0304 family)
MKLTKIERAILANQQRILSYLDNGNEENYLFKAQILEEGYEGMYEEAFTGIFDGVSEEICEETFSILNMYRTINNAIQALNPNQIPEQDLEKIKFQGFDANNDKHYYFMKFLVEKADRFDEYRDMYLNSHSLFPLRKYRRMLEVYNQMMSNTYRDLTAVDLRFFIESI